MLRPVLPAAIGLLFLGGCKAPPSSALHRPAGGYVYNAPGEKEIDRRAIELQRHGYTKEGARQKAKTELAAKAWQPDESSAEAWAYEQARQARSAANGQMEKDLAKLTRD